MKKGVIIAYCTFIAIALFGIFFDAKISLAVSSIRINFLNEVMIMLSSSIFWAVIGIILSVFLFTHKRGKKKIPPLWISVILSVIAANIIKLFFMRERPFDAIEIIALIKASGSSFPSGHAAAAFSAFAVFYSSRFKWIALALACLVVFSRVYLGVHYLTDVAIGALIGFSAGLIILKLFSKNKD